MTVTGALTVARFPVFAHIDERAHYAYLQEVAEHHRLPVLGRTLVSDTVLALDDGRYPGPSGLDPRTAGLVEQSYEAFQPPLYYLVAAPVFAIPGDHEAKLYAVRALDLVLLLAAVGLLALLAREVGGRRWVAAFCLACSVLLWPGVVVRQVTISNSALELPLALAFLLCCWRAHARRAPRWLIAAGVALGLSLLTKLTLLYLAPLLLLPAVTVVRESRSRHTLVAAGLAVLAPLVLLAPWVASNLQRYGALTANSLARDLQSPVLNPTHRTYGLGDVEAGVGRLFDGVLPQEWWSQFGRTAWAVVLRAVPIALLLAALVPLLHRPALVRTRAAALLALPLGLVVVEMVATLLGSNWDIFLPRYLYAAALALALFAAWAWQRRTPTDTGLLVLAGASTAIVGVDWAVLAATRLFAL